MPGSSTTPDRTAARSSAAVRVAFRLLDSVSIRTNVSFTAQWLACTYPCRRFADVLADACARLGADVGCYSLIVMDLHHLLLAGLPAHPKKTFEAAAQVQARLIVQLKDNQPSLLQKVETACASQRPVSSDTSVCTGRNRHETRSAEVFSATRSVAATEWNSLIKSIVRVTREVLHRDAKTGLWSSTSEVAYYVANSAVSACLAATAIRHHWNVENALHYTRDVTFQEDQSRIRCNPGVFARLRSFAYNVLCRNRTSTFSQDRYAAALAGFSALANWCFS